MGSKQGMINGIIYDNFVQKAILLSSLEESGIWEALIDIVDDVHVDRSNAFGLLKSEINYLIAQDDIYLVYSEKLYDTGTSKALDKKELLKLTLEDVEFREEGPFYYFSSVPEI